MGLEFVESNKLQDRVRGNHKGVKLVVAKNPFQKIQTIKATITVKPATFTEKAVKEVHVFHGSFMEVISKVQSRWPKKQVSYQTIAWTEPKES